MAPRRPLVLLVLLFALPLAAAERPITPRVVTPATAEPLRSATSIAFGASTVLVAWNEGFSPIYPEVASGIFVRLFHKDGTPVHDVQIPVAAAGIDPHVVWNGSEYVIAYTLPVSRFDTFPHPIIGITRVREDGTIVSSHTVGSAVGTLSISGFAINGDRLMLVVSETELFLLDRDGNFESRKFVNPLVQSITPYRDGFAVATTEVAVRPLSRDGVLGDRIAAIAPFGMQAVIASHDDQLAVVWRTTNAVYATTVNGTQTMLAANAMIAKVTSLTWTGDAWATAWMTSSGACMVRFNDNAVGDAECLDSEFQHDPFVKSDGVTTVFGWSTGRADSGSNNQVFVTFSIPDRALLASATATSQRLVAADESDGGLDVVWSEGAAVHLGRFTLAGEMQSDRIIGNGAAFHLAAGLLVWAQGSDIHALRIHTDAPDIILGSGSEPRVAFDGRQWLVVWQSTDVAHTQILGAAVTLNGDATTAAPIESNGSRQFSPEVAANDVTADDHRFVVSWMEQPPSANEFEGMSVRMVDESGHVISNRIEFKQPAEGIDGVQSIPSSLACGGSYCAVTWNDRAGFFLRDLSYGGPIVVLYGSGTAAVRYLGDERWAFDVLVSNQIVERTFDPSGDLLRSRVLIAAPANFVVLPDAIVFTRPTAPEEMFGGSRRLFIAAAPTLRGRVARH